MALGDNDGDSAYRRGITVMDGESFAEAVQRSWRAEVSAIRADINDAERDLEQFFADDLGHPIDVEITLSGLLVGLLLIAVPLIIVGTIARHVSEAALIQMVDQGRVTAKSARDLLAELTVQGGDPEALVQERGLGAVSDAALLESVVDEVIAANPDVATAYAQGDKKVVNFLMGQVMKKTQGKADPGRVREILARKLGV